jgi:DNA polymerase I
MELGRLAAWTLDRWQSDAPATIAIDTETEGVGFFDRPFCFTFTWRRPSGDLTNGYIELDQDAHAEYVTEILSGSDTWIFHNAKFDLQKILLEGYVPRSRFDQVTLHDTEAMWHLLDNIDRKGLKYLAAKHLGDEGLRLPEKRLAKVRRSLKLKKDDGYLYLPREFVVPYAMSDTNLTYRLAVLGLPKVTAQEKLAELYRDEMSLTLALLDMEAAGLRLDVEYAQRMADEYGTKIMATLGRIRELSGKDDLNPASPKQLKEAFGERGLRVDSTNEETLMAVEDELAAEILTFRKLTKIHKTYFVALLEEHRDGIVHPNFRQHGARTGRMSSGGATE